MKIINKLISLSLFIILLTGCSYNQKNKHIEDVELTDKQKQILVDSGIEQEISTIDKEQLDIIEDALQYLENKYNKEFIFLQYSKDSLLGNNYMLAHCKSDDSVSGSFIVGITEDGFSDTYMSKAIRFEFRDYIKNELDTITKNTPSEVIVDVVSTNLTDIPTDHKDFDNNIESSIWIFFDGEYTRVSDTEESTVEIKDWMEEHKLYGVTHIILLNNNSISQLDSSNFTEYLTDKDYKLKETFTIYRNK